MIVSTIKTENIAINACAVFNYNKLIGARSKVETYKETGRNKGENARDHTLPRETDTIEIATARVINN